LRALFANAGRHLTLLPDYINNPFRMPGATTAEAWE